MKKIVLINSLPVGSTGNICRKLLYIAKENGYQAFFLYGSWKDSIVDNGAIKFGSKIDNYASTLLARITGLGNHYNFFSTKSLLKQLRFIKPDIIHLHNLHLNYLNLNGLFKYINKNKIPVVWTFRDCWPFTGRCPYFLISKCKKWKTECKKCIYPKNMYPQTFVDRSCTLWKQKKKFASNVKNLTIVTPSKWLSSLVKKSFFKNHMVEIINNGIDLNIFKPTENNFRERYSIKAKYLIIGVAFDWGYRKGLDVFVEMSKRLDDDYKIVLVGTNEAIDKILPTGIISIHRTHNQNELAGLYSSGDVFVNPTREDNFPTVNIEALACGTPVLTFRTGGSAEIIDDTCGSSVDCDDLDGLIKEITRICTEKPFKKESCLNRAKLFDSNDKFKDYINLYDRVVHK